MKTLLLLLLLAVNSWSQPYIQKKDSTRVPVLEAASVRDDPSQKRLYFLSADTKIEEYISYNDLAYASFSDKLFKTFIVNKKVKGFFVLAASAGKSLVLSKEKRYKNRGGFETLYTHYELGVIDAHGNLLKDIMLTDEKTAKASAARAKAYQMIRTQFADCKGLMERVSMFESPKSDAKHLTILVFLNAPAYYNCQ